MSHMFNKQRKYFYVRKKGTEKYIERGIYLPTVLLPIYAGNMC